ncbi:MAG TPA: hypothetical protein VIK30_11605 [Polyangia bacterium]
MTRAFQALALPILAAASLAACGPAKSPQAAAPPVAAAAPAPPPVPPRHATMICRNSQDGRKVACGTPNAVMVGIKQD